MAEPSSADDLYALDPAEFTAARDALARALRADGRRDEAGEIKKLRRPPQSAWALNLLARTEPELIDAVLEAATALRDALADGGSDRRAAQDGYRAAIDAAVAAAASLADVSGEDMRTRIRTNLLAAGVDEAVARQVQRGALPDDQEAPGFGGAPTIGPLARTSRGTSPAKPGSKRAERPGSTAESRSGTKAGTASRSRASTASGSTSDADGRRERRAEAAARQQADADELARRRVARQRAELEREIARLEKKAARLTTQAEGAEERAAEARRLADEANAALADATERLGQL